MATASSKIGGAGTRGALGVRPLRRRFSTAVVKATGDRVAAVAAEVLQRHLDAGSRLPTFVFRETEHTLDLRHRLAIKAFGDDAGDRLLALDQPFEDLIEHIVGRQRIL